MDLIIYEISIVALIIGVVELAKQLGLPTKYGGIVAVILGVGTSIGYSVWAENPLFQAVITGVALGLTASGLYSTAKNTLEGVATKKKEG